MERKRPEVFAHNTPEERLRRNFKFAVVLTEGENIRDLSTTSPEDLFEKKKKIQCVLRGVKEMSDQEFVEDWLITADIPPFYALEMGKALGELEIAASR